MDGSFYRHPAGADNLLCFYGSFRKFHIKLYQRIRKICSELHIMGGGPDLDRLKQYACDGIKFYGYIPYAEMMSVAKGCDISVNAIHSYAMQSITNKLSDYMALQKPILNSQVNDEVAEVLTLLPHADYRSGDVDSFVQAAKDILARKNDPVQSDEIVRRFKRDVAYQKIVNLIERLAHE